MNDQNRIGDLRFYKQSRQFIYGPNLARSCPMFPNFTPVATMSDCPRCQLPMIAEQYEGEDVQFCNSCWGHWVQPASFKKILQAEVYEFSKSDKESVIKRWSGNNSTMMRTSADIGCPDCGQTMKQIPFATGCGVVVDSCNQHGIWLDGGEIKRIQIFIDERQQG